MASGQQTGKKAGAAPLGRIGKRPLWVLYLSIGVRAVHQVGVAVVLASVLLGDMEVPASYLIVATLSGMVLMVTEGMRHRQFYREFSGLATLIKVILLGLAFHGPLSMTVTVVITFILASISAHVPKIVRHRLLY